MPESPRTLKRFHEDGNDLYQYMCEQFRDELKDEYQRVKYFEFRFFPNQSYTRQDEIDANYTQTIQPEVLQWIRKERDSGRLFDKKNWRSWAVIGDYGTSYIGYHFLFPYQQYYFQLGVDFFCNCKHEPDEDGNELHFQLALYGWKEEGTDYVQPDNKYILTEDLSMPEGDEEYTYSLE